MNHECKLSLYLLITIPIINVFPAIAGEITMNIDKKELNFRVFQDMDQKKIAVQDIMYKEKNRLHFNFSTCCRWTTSKQTFLYPVRSHNYGTYSRYLHRQINMVR